MPAARAGRRFPRDTIPGVRLVITDRTRYRAVRTAMLLIDTIHRLWPNEFEWTGASPRQPGVPTVDRLAGTDQFRLAVAAGTLGAKWPEWDRQAEAFRKLREPFLLYR